MSKPILYIVEDSIAAGAMYKAYLEKKGYEVSHFVDGFSAMSAIKNKVPDVIIQDVCLPDVSGIDVLKFAKKIDKKTEVVVITSNSSIDVAVTAMREGAYDFIEKPFENEILLSAVQSALEQSISGGTQTVSTNLSGAKVKSDIDFIGDSISVQTVKRILNSAARSKASVFVTGESGTGKEVCAEYLHDCSNRHDKSFVAINCAAIPADLFESEFFGHVKGAFSGAISDRKGAVEMANGGTLFLDELCEMALPLQAKLLRFLQTGLYSRVGSSDVVSSDVRVVCATNRNPQKEVADGRFREDLYYRLNVIPVNLPPLREREEDIIILAHFFLQQKCKSSNKLFKGFSKNTEKAFLSYDWPGNIRELQNVIENCVVMNEGDTVELDMLPQFKKEALKSNVSTAKKSLLSEIEAELTDEIIPLWQVEKEAIESAVHICNGNIPLAAVKLGISASTLYRKIKNWEELA